MADGRKGPVPASWWPPRLTAAGLLLSLLALGAPLVYSGGVLFPFVVPKAAWFRLMTAGMAGLLLHGVLTRESQLSWRRDPVLPGLAALLAVSIVAAGLGVAPLRSFFGDLERMGGVWALLHVVVLYVALRSFVTPEKWPAVMRVVGAVVVALALSGLLHGYGVWIFGNPSWRPGGLTGNPGYLAAAMLLGAAVIGGLVSRTRGLERWVWALGLAFCLHIMFMAQTRAVLLGLMVGGPVAAMTYLSFSRRLPRWWVPAGVGIILTLGAIAWVGSRAPAVRGLVGAVPVVERLATTDVAGEWRLYVWGKATEAYAVRPFLGWGPENEAIAMESRIDGEHYSTLHAKDRTDRSHNAYLGLLVTTGLPGLSAFLLFFAGVFLALQRGLRFGRMGSMETALLMGALAGYAVYLVFWFEDLTTWVLLTAIAARAGSAAAGRPLVEVGSRRPRRSVPILAGTWVILAVLVVAQAVLPLRQAALVGRAEYEPDLTVEQRLGLLESALRAPATQRFQAILRHQTFVQKLSGDEDVRGDPFRLARVVQSAGTGMSTTRAELNNDPLNSGLTARLAIYGIILFEFTQDEEYIQEARDVLSHAILQAPRQLRLRHLLSQVELVAGRPDRADEILRETLAIHDGFGETHHYLAGVSLHENRLDEAVRWVEESAARRYRPGDPDLHIRLARVLESSGRVSHAARVQHLYLVAVYCGEPLDGDSEPEPLLSGEAVALRVFCAGAAQASHALGSLRLRDAEVVAQLPTLRLRAGDTHGAMDAALLLGRLAPRLRGEVAAFVQDVRDGRVEHWLERDMFMAPERVGAALEQQRAETAAGG